MNAWKMMCEVYLISAGVAFFVALVIKILVHFVSKAGEDETISAPKANAVTASDDDAAIAVAIAAAKRASGK